MSNACPAAPPESSTSGVFVFEVDYGGSEAEYARNFRALLAACKSPLVNAGDLAPENYPSDGRRGRHLRCVQFLPSVADHWTEEAVRDVAKGRQLHPLDLIALCVRYQDLGCGFPLLSSFEQAWRDGYGNRKVVYVSASGGGRTFDVASDCGVGYSKNCRFPIAVDPEAKAA